MAEVKIIVSAETQQAAAALRNFVQNGAREIQILGRSAQEASAHMGGMMYSFRSGIDAIRAVAAGGGDRAIFYSMDEGIRGLIASGMKIGTLVPIIGAVAAAAGAGALAWKAWNTATQETIDLQKQLAASFKELPTTLKTIQDNTKAGLISPSVGQEFQGYLSGQQKYYVDKNGQVTTNPTEQVSEMVPTGIGDPSLGIPSPMEQRTENVPNKAATDEQVQKYFHDLATAGGNITPEQTAAALGVQTDEREIAEAAMSPAEKAVADIQDRMEKLREKIQIEMGVASAKISATDTGGFFSQILGMTGESVGGIPALSGGKLKQAQDAIRQIQQEEQDAIAAVQNKTDDHADKADDHRADASQKIADLEAQAHADTLTGIAQEIAAVQDKYEKERQEIMTTALAAGKVQGDLQVQSALEETQRAEQAEIEKKITAQKEKQLQLQLEMAKAQADAKLKQIEGNPFLDSQQKAQLSIPVIQSQLTANSRDMGEQENIATTTTDDSARAEALNKINGLMGEQIELQQKLATAQGESSWSSQMVVAVTNLESMNNLAKEGAQTFSGVFNSGIESVSGGIAHALLYTENWRQKLAQIGTNILQQIIQGIIQMGLRWVMTQLMMAAVGRSILASAVATSAPAAAAAAVIWAPAATMSTIATMGGAAAQAPAMISMAEAASMGIAAFAEGGRPQPGQLSLVGERGPELFIPDAAGTIIPAHETAAMMGDGGLPVRSGGAAGDDQDPWVHKVVVAWHPQALQDELKKSDYKKITVAHVASSKRELGMKT
jgi:hypothetical protein